MRHITRWFHYIFLISWCLLSLTAICRADASSTKLEDLQALAQFGDAEAQYQLGVIEETQTPSWQADQRALQWYHRAAELDHAGAQARLGLFYRLGRGVDVDLNAAQHWLTQAATANHVVAQYNLGVMYELNQIVGGTQEHATYWYARAANQSLAAAQYRFGLQLLLGRGIPTDAVDGYAWLSLAAVNRHPLANQTLQRLATELTETQLLEAHARATQLQHQK